MSEYEYIITINSGLEQISASEVKGITGRNVKIGDNILRLNGSEEDGYKLILWGRTIHRVLLLIDEGEFTDLDDLGWRVERIDFRSYFKRGLRFALKTNRYGEHDFTSLDVNRVIGGVINRKLRLQDLDPKVDLDNPDIQFIMRVINDKYMLAVNLVGESLHVRGYRRYNHPVAIKTSIAAAMILLSDWNDEDFIDPMAGGGTIPIEAALYKYRYAPGLYRKTHPIINIPIFNPELYYKYRENAEESKLDNLDINILYNDISRKYMDGAIINASSAGVDKFIKFLNFDVRYLHKYHIPLRDGFIAVFNPPYGIRMTRDKAIPSLYRDVVNTLVNLGCKRIITITASWRSMIDAFEYSSVKLVRRIQVKHGQLDTFILDGVVG